MPLGPFATMRVPMMAVAIAASEELVDIQKLQCIR
jgi:hypothetical protein